MTIEDNIRNLENRNSIDGIANVEQSTEQRIAEIEGQLVKLTDTLTALAGGMEGLANRLNEQTQLFAMTIQQAMQASTATIDNIADELSNIYAALEGAPLTERPDYKAYRAWVSSQKGNEPSDADQELF